MVGRLPPYPEDTGRVTTRLRGGPSVATDVMRARGKVPRWVGVSDLRLQMWVPHTARSCTRAGSPLTVLSGPSRSPQVDPTKYYEACVGDACACDSGGDCECFCTAVAAYAQACHDVGVCVSWRTPDICRECI